MDDGVRRPGREPAPSVPPGLAGAVGSAAAQARSRPATRTERHLELVDSLSGLLHDGALGRDAARRWAVTALHACLAHLLTSEVTEAARVSVIDAWVDDEDALCIVYVPPFDKGRLVGVRRTRYDAAFPDYWRLGDRTGWGYELDARIRQDSAAAPATDVDPVAFGWNVADFDVGEPLGYVTTILRHDRADVGWWGDLRAELPVPPTND